MFFTVSVRKNQSRLQNTAFLLVANQTRIDFTHRLGSLKIYIFSTLIAFDAVEFLVGLYMDIKND